MDWSLCVVCQEEGSEIPRCPKDRPSRLGDPRAVYERFLENIDKFRDLKSLPVNRKLCSDIIVDILYNENAKWHHGCHQRYTQSQLERIINRKRKLEANEDSHKKQDSGPKRRESNKLDILTCIFCSSFVKGNKKLHDVSTIQFDANLRKMAMELAE